MINTTLSLDTWKRFVNEGVLDSSRLDKKVIESWYRCREADIDPYLEKGQHILTSDRLKNQKKQNSFFLDIALPHVKKMNQLLKDLGMVALLIGPKGYVLSLTGHKEVVNEAKKINFVKGVRWTEDEVGTNAIGTALQAREAIMITGAEHYSVASHNWSCSAAPIHNDDGELLGIIDVSCPMDCSHPYMFGMVTSVAYAIERELSIQVHKDEMELLHRSMDLIDGDRPLIICNNKHMVIGASKPIRASIPKWVGMKANEVLKHGFDTQIEAPVFSKHHGGLIGKCMYLLEDETDDPNQFSFSQPFYFKGEIGTSKIFQQTIEKVKHVAPTDASTYISGETGTGKDVIAQSIHENSPRKNRPFIAVNCGAIPKELMASELFGYVEGAFTGARRQGYKGKFEQANRGTIFLDEIGEIPHSMQVALLRVLQERKITPVGSTKEIPLDIRFITATNRDLLQLVQEGKFREDLYYRLHVYPINVPPLRERQEDIPHLVRYYCKKNSWHLEFPQEVLTRMMNYHWPGNIRELFNVVERLYILSQGKPIDTKQLMHGLQAMDIQGTSNIKDHDRHKISADETELSSKDLTIREKIQRDLMIDALRKTKGNVTLAAKMLDIPRSTFYKRIKKFEL